MFSRSRNLQINGGVFTQSNGPLIFKRTGLELLLDAASPSAFHNSGERFDPPKCYPNTRTAILTEIMDWIVGKIGWDRYIMWLYGPAGAGKSAIAQTIAELCRAKGILLASFFFSRSDPKRNNVRPLAASLAYQVAVNVPEARRLIESVVENDPAIFDKSFEGQFKALIVGPLMHINKSGISSKAIPYVIVVDGLDECADPNVQRHILKTTADLSSYKSSIRLMFMFSSRAEREINLTFSTSTFEGVTTRIALDDTYQSEADIRIYLEGSFSEMKQTHLQKKLIPPTWPEDNDISLLVRKSSGQFIYAATVIRYISSSRYTPMNSLQIILGLRPTRNDAPRPFAELDALYRDVLSRVEDTSATLQLLGAIIHLDNGNTLSLFLEEFLFLDKGDVARLLVDVSSLVAIDSDPDSESDYIRFLHASFGDFLSDPDRSKEYYINPAMMCTELVFLGLRHVEGYNVGFDACSLALWFIKHLHNMLLRANPTDGLRERFFRAPFLNVLFTSLDRTELEIAMNDFHVQVNNLFLVLKTSRFFNTEELYLHHRGAWDEILRQYLAKIESDAVMATIVASTHANLNIDVLCKVLEAKFRLEKKGLLKQQIFHMKYIAIILKIPPRSFYDEYRNLVLGFLRDPNRAGKYLLDAKKMAILSLILLETLTRPGLIAILDKMEAFHTFCTLYNTIPEAGPFEDLIVLINIPEIKFPHNVLQGLPDLDGEMCERTVQVFGKYLDRICGSVPIGFRITVEGKEGQNQVSYYYDPNNE